MALAISTNLPGNTRNVLDANFIASIALPNAANTVNTNSLNLVQATPFPVTEKINVQILTTQSTGANSKNINVVMQHSADNASWTNIPELAAPLKVVAGNATNFPASNVVVKLPPSAKQYIRAQATGEANGGNASDGTVTIQVLF